MQSVYEMYYSFEEPVSRLAGHRILALNRGEKEKILNVKIEAPEESAEVPQEAPEAPPDSGENSEEPPEPQP